MHSPNLISTWRHLSSLYSTRYFPAFFFWHGRFTSVNGIFRSLEPLDARFLYLYFLFTFQDLSQSAILCLVLPEKFTSTLTANLHSHFYVSHLRVASSITAKFTWTSADTFFITNDLRFACLMSPSPRLCFSTIRDPTFIISESILEYSALRLGTIWLNRYPLFA